MAQVGAGEAEQSAPKRKGVYTGEGRPFVLYVDVGPEQDAALDINEAIEAARRAGGGTIFLPPGQLNITSTICFAGSLARFPRGAPRGIILSGCGGEKSTTLIWQGPEGQPVIDLPSPWGCQVRNLAINGQNVPGAIGVRYRGGYERHANSGKNNLFENLTITCVDVGIEVGDQFGPDLVGGTFRNIWIMYMRIGVRLMGAT